jgi:pyruvate/2-oxoglutarate dehydrogenase complex dihydrolipoamide dehydrogenase (E3) component
VNKRLRICLLVCASLVLADCKNLPMGGTDGSTESSAEAQMREDSIKFSATVIGGAAAGCAIGAVVSALGCKVSGSDSHKSRQCAGGLRGAGRRRPADGYYVAKAAASRDKVRETMRRRRHRQDNQRIQAFLDSSSVVVAESRARLARIHADTASRKLTADQAAGERRKIEQNRDLMQNTLDEMKKSRDVYVGAAKQASSAQGSNRNLDSEIRQMNQKIAALERSVRIMNTALSVSRS